MDCGLDPEDRAGLGPARQTYRSRHRRAHMSGEHELAPGDPTGLEMRVSDRLRAGHHASLGSRPIWTSVSPGPMIGPELIASTMPPFGARASVVGLPQTS